MNNGENALNKADSASAVSSRFFPTPPEFEGCFTTFYRLDLQLPDDQVMTDYMQPEWPSIRFFSGARPTAQIGNTTLNGSRFGASGPSSLPTRFTIGSTRMWGIGFLPLGWARFFDYDASTLVNQAVDGETHPAFCHFADLADVLCDDGVDEKDQYAAIVEAMQAHARPHRDEERLLCVHRALLDKQLGKVTDFADQSGLTVRSLERICLRYFGFPPKVLMRRQRFMRSLTTFMLESKGSWSEAMDQHYHDQAQFSREFRQFMTMSPSQYAALDHPFMKSFLAARAKMLGSAAQTLDTPDA